MSDQDQALPAPPEAASNQSNPTVLVLVGVVVLLAVLLMVDFKNEGPASVAPAAVPAHDGSASPSSQSPEALAARITGDSTALAALTIELQERLAHKQDEIDGVKTLYTAASRSNEEMKIQLDAAKLGSTEAATLRAEFERTRGLLDQANKHVQTLQIQLADSPDAGALAAMQENAVEAARMRDESMQKVRNLENRIMTMVSLDEFSAVNDELAASKERLLALQPENNELRYEIQRLRKELNKTRLFVDKVDDLPAAAKMLFVELSKLETVSSDKLGDQYTRIEQDLKATVVDTISFETGSSRINLDKADEIRQATRDAGDDSYFLVVGYASKTGDFDTNKKLSADRATTIASVADVNKKEGQGVQAVFLGQTDRFAASDVLKNQICEIWEIRE